jgi:hypothetical protein
MRGAAPMAAVLLALPQGECLIGQSVPTLSRTVRPSAPAPVALIAMGMLDSYPTLQRRTRRALDLGASSIGGMFVAEVVIVTMRACGVPLTPSPRSVLTLGAVVAPAVRVLCGAVPRHASKRAKMRELSEGARIERRPLESTPTSALLGEAMRLDRLAHEMNLEMSARRDVVAARQAGMEAARKALESARRWAGGLSDLSDMSNADIGAIEAQRRAADARLLEAAARFEALRCEVESDRLLLLEMEARVDAMRAEAIAAGLRARDAQPGFFARARAPPLGGPSGAETWLGGGAADAMLPAPGQCDEDLGYGTVE